MRTNGSSNTARRKAGKLAGASLAVGGAVLAVASTVSPSANALPPRNGVHQTCPAPPDDTVTRAGKVQPQYNVLTIVYAPPGCGTSTKSCSGASSVDYQTTTKTGTAITIGETTKASLSIAASAGVQSVASVTATVGTTHTNGDSNKQEVYLSYTRDMKIPGPGGESTIDHTYDRIYLILNPEVGDTVTYHRPFMCEVMPNGLMNTATSHFIDVKNGRWDPSMDPAPAVDLSYGFVGGTAQVTYVTVGWLKNPSTMPPGVAATLNAAHILPRDYPAILARDPFGAAAQSIVPTGPVVPAGTSIPPHLITSGRFKETTYQFTYIPPSTANDPSDNQSVTIKDDATTTTSHESDDEYWVELKASVGDVLTSMTVDGKLDMTDTSLTAHVNENTTQSTAQINDPSFGYAGPTQIYTWIDTVYNTFVFTFDDPTHTYENAVTGTVTHGGAAAAGVMVMLVDAQGKTHRTFTNGRGQYLLSAPRVGSGSLTVAGLAAQHVTFDPHAAVRLSHAL